MLLCSIRLQWRYELADDGSWRPVVDEDQPAGVDVSSAYNGPVGDGIAPGAILAVPRRPEDEAEINRLEVAVQDLEHEGDPAAYGQALAAALLQKAAELVPGGEVGVDAPPMDALTSFAIRGRVFWALGDLGAELVAQLVGDVG